MDFLARRPLLMLLALVLAGCGGGSEQQKNLYQSDQKQPTRGDYVFIHLLSTPESLHPNNSSDAAATRIQNNLFQTLLHFDPETYELVPWLAQSRPTISDNGKQFTFEIREDAVWPNGSPITGKDVAFTIKTIKNPKVDCQHLRPYLDFVEDVQVDPDNPRKFTVHSNKKYYLAESSIGATPYILPRYFYDKQELMADVTIPELNNKSRETLLDNKNIVKFAEEFNKARYSNDPAYFVGSGPYKLKAYETDQEIVLQRKEDYWANGKRTFPLEAYPERLVYRIVKDQNTAVEEIKSQNLDVMRGIPPKKFKTDMEGNARVENHYNLHTPQTFAYSLIGLNNRPKDRPPFFVDRKVRYAMAHLLNTEQIIEKLLYGFGEPIIGPISPLREGAYNDTIQQRPYNLQKARKLLAQAGWEDSNGDGTRDKQINGQRQEFVCQFSLSTGNQDAEKIALLLQKEAQKVGIKIELRKLDWSSYIPKLDNKNYDLFLLAWSSAPNGGDLRQLWHTEQIADGSNYIGFGDAKSDKLIEKINTTLDDKKRHHLKRRFQEILHKRQPCLFLTAPETRIAVHKRFRNTKVGPLRPNYQAKSFWTPEAHVKYKQQ